MPKNITSMMPFDTLTAKRSSGRKQRGIATVLMMLLIGLSLSVGVLGTTYYVRSTQDQGMSTHAQAQAQMKAWTATELVRMYLQQLQTDGNLTSFLAQTMPFTVNFTGDGGTSDGATGSMSAVFTSVNTAASTVTVEVTGVAARGTKAEASSKMQEIFSTATSSTASAVSQQCVTTPKAVSFFKGATTISGDTTSFSNGSNYASIIVDGNLTIGTSSSVFISGCVKGDINMTGGGIQPNATLSAEGTITLSSVTPPTNATFWAKNISIGNSGVGSYTSVKAGAYAASVVSGGVTIGSTNVGGNLIPATTGTTIPWTTGSVIPLSSGSIVITLTDGTQFLLDMSKTSISPTTGVVTNTSSASRLSGTGTLPNTLAFTSLSIYGGNLTSSPQAIQQVWGNKVSLNGSFAGGNYTNVLSNDEVQLGLVNVTNLVGGNDLWANLESCYSTSPTSCSNGPTIKTKGSIAGPMYIGSSKKPGMTLSNLAQNQTNTSPGLPGVPYCDTRASTVSADPYKSQANYVFELVNALPQLTIQNVNNSQGQSIAGVYSLVAPTPAQQLVLSSLMTCNNTNTPGCLQTAGTPWRFYGITKFMPGVLWFDSAVTFDGSTVDLLNSVIGKGNLTLTSNGHMGLTAPNFSTPALICDGANYPSNLCNKTTSPSSFTTWKDASGVSYNGLPIANTAIMVEGSLATAGWPINGNVILGGQITTSGTATSIVGSFSAGANTPGVNAITSSGLSVNMGPLSASQVYLPSTSCTATPPTTTSIKLLSSRYI